MRVAPFWGKKKKVMVIEPVNNSGMSCKSVLIRRERRIESKLQYLKHSKPYNDRLTHYQGSYSGHEKIKSPENQERTSKTRLPVKDNCPF